ncbi:hypothetical protein BSPA14S_0899 [Borreliella spielmanii A14S]|uniref:Uncharacterized protein n=1 Tax=Borreliella spielmanii A14S TaxID=498742 RepID=B9X878_9SPIR|nr:hypothetical protein BSPA14S_0899 [Borreliella spielmanii A14S]
MMNSFFMFCEFCIPLTEYLMLNDCFFNKHSIKLIFIIGYY